MKTIALLALCIAVASAVHAAALPPIPPGAVSLDVELVQVSTKTTTPWQTWWGSYHKRFSAQRALRVRARLFGTFDPNVIIEWRFVAQRIGGGLYVYDSGSREAVIEKPQSDIGIFAKPISGEDHNYNAINRRDTSGGKPYGYAVRVTQNGVVLAAKESSAGLLALPLPR